MKRTIVIETILLITVILLICCSVYLFDDVKWFRFLIRHSMEDEQTVKLLYKELSLGILTIIFAVANLAAMALIAVQNFQCFKPLLDKLKAKRDARKAAKETAAAEKAEADKQARIEQLQNELDELKKNG